MKGSPLSVVLLPTLGCNAACEYCYQDRTGRSMTISDFKLILNRLMDYMEVKEVPEITLYWQGGEIFTMEPDWFLRALETIESLQTSRGLRVSNHAQSNLIGYRPEWNMVLREMFGNQLGSSLDFPNLYRKARGGDPDSYNELWILKYEEAAAHGIEVSVISLPNQATLEVEPRAFYSYYVQTVGLKSFQVNTLFPGGGLNAVKRGLPINPQALASFEAELIDVWMSDGLEDGIVLAPYDAIIDYFLDERRDGLPCVYSENCADQFISIDPEGNVAQCDCWVTSYPDLRFGNILFTDKLDDIMKSPQREDFLIRPMKIVQNFDCWACDFLALCHGGCPVQAYSSYGVLFEKDPHCVLHRKIFAKCREVAHVLLASPYRKNWRSIGKGHTRPIPQELP